MALKFTVHVASSIIHKGTPACRKSGVSILETQLIEVNHLQWNNGCFLPVTATHNNNNWTSIVSLIPMHALLWSMESSFKVHTVQVKIKFPFRIRRTLVVLP